MVGHVTVSSRPYKKQPCASCVQQSVGQWLYSYSERRGWEMQRAFLVVAVLRAALGQPDSQHASALPFPVGDPRNCETTVGDQAFFRMEVLPGLGWDNLRNLDQSVVLVYNYSTCKTTNDRKYLIPDDSFVIPLQRSKVDTYSELVSHALNYTSMTSSSINAGASVFSDISGKFSTSFMQVKRHFYKQQSEIIMSRIQVKHQRYVIKSSPDAQLAPSFKNRLFEIAAQLQSNKTRMATYLAELLVRDYGTHYVHTTYAGAILAQEDFVRSNYMSQFSRHSSSVSASASANFFGKVGFSFGTSHSSSQETDEYYTKNVTYSHILTYGGPPFGSNFSVNMWEAGIDNALVAIDREGDPIYYVLTPDNLPEIPPPTAMEVSKLVEKAVKSYYRYNTRHGCTNPSSPNFNYRANVDDHSCKAPAMNFSFGGAYQTCSKTTHDPKDPICPDLLQKNPLTGAYSCPSGYLTVELNTGTKSTTYQKTSCNKVCHRSWFHKRCKPNCVKYNVISSAQYRTFWCAVLGKVPPETGFLFGGLYTTSTPNPLTHVQSCPSHYMALRFGEEGHVCVSNDYELGYQFSQPFTGFDSCHVGNPLAVPEEQRSSASSTWPKTCPPGFSQHLAMVDDGCEINFCLKAGVLNDDGFAPIKRPPFIRTPVEVLSGLTVAFLTTSGELWVKDDTDSQQWKEIDADSKEFFQILKDSGLLNITNFTSIEFASEPLMDPTDGLSVEGAAGIGVGATLFVVVITIAIMFGINKLIRYLHTKKQTAASLGGDNPVGHQISGDHPLEEDARLSVQFQNVAHS